ncbi:hypothetical protein LZ32DRAFT_208796 [Colletotrichum eremochloae]|nr:hypothetical protein LZ32DRAFT_208796 [Colletotrichum eremochloae]
MTSSSYPDTFSMTEAQHMALSSDATSLGQTSFLSHTNNNQLCQQWPPGWDHQTYEPVFSPGISAGSMSSVEWDAERQSHQSFEAIGPPNYTTASWPLQPGDWFSYQKQQQYLQSPQSAILSPPLQWPGSTCDPLTVDPAQQPPPKESHNRSEPESEPEHRATAMEEKATTPLRKGSDPNLATMRRNHPKKPRVGAGGARQPPCASSMPYDGNGARTEDDNEGEDSDPSSVPAGPDSKRPYRVKNRAAAKRCRQKTKQYEIDLVNKERDVTEERMFLDACVTSLKNEVLSLKNEILRHSSCDCSMIQDYIVRTASTVSVGEQSVPVTSPPWA